MRKFVIFDVTSAIMKRTQTLKSSCTRKTFTILIERWRESPRCGSARFVEEVSEGTMHWPCISEKSTWKLRNINAIFVLMKVTENMKWKVILSMSMLGSKRVIRAHYATQLLHHPWDWRFTCNINTRGWNLSRVSAERVTAWMKHWKCTSGMFTTVKGNLVRNDLKIYELPFNFLICSVQHVS